MGSPPLFKPLVIFAAFLSIATGAMAEISTLPMGYLAIKVAAGTPGAPVTTSFAIPLTDEPLNAGVTTGRIADLTSDQITVADAGWTPGKLGTKSAPYAVRITSGVNDGLTLVITDNTADTLTVESEVSLTTLGLKKGTTGTQLQLIPIDTLDSLFGDDTLIGAKKSLNADVVYLGAHKQAGYFYNTALGKWVSTDGSEKNCGNTPILPEAAVRVARVGPEITLFFDGRVPETTFIVDIANSGKTYTHTGFPVDTTLAELALQTKIPNWAMSKNSDKADKIAVASGNSWVTYFYTGSKWRSTTGGTTSQGSTVIKAGVPIRINRIGDATGTTALSIPRPYKIK